MNTKGMKFLAVLAVLAMAFAAFAVIAPAETDDAATATATVQVTTAEGSADATTDTTKDVVSVEYTTGTVVLTLKGSVDQTTADTKSDVEVYVKQGATVTIKAFGSDNDYFKSLKLYLETSVDGTTITITDNTPVIDIPGPLSTDGITFTASAAGFTSSYLGEGAYASLSSSTYTYPLTNALGTITAAAADGITAVYKSNGTVNKVFAKVKAETTGVLTPTVANDTITLTLGTAAFQGTINVISGTINYAAGGQAFGTATAGSASATIAEGATLGFLTDANAIQAGATISGNGTLVNGVNGMTNAGAIDVGAFTVPNTVTGNTGSIKATTLTPTAAITSSGSLTFGTTGTALATTNIGPNVLENNTGDIKITAGYVTSSTDFTILANKTLEIAGGYFAGADNVAVTIAGTLKLTSGTFQMGADEGANDPMTVNMKGNVLINEGATLDLNGTALDLNAATASTENTGARLVNEGNMLSSNGDSTVTVAACALENAKTSNNATFISSKTLSNIVFAGAGNIELDVMETLRMSDKLASSFTSQVTQKVLIDGNLTIKSGQYLRIRGDIEIPEGVTVTIEEGGELTISGSSATAEIYGNIKAQGLFQVTGTSKDIVIYGKLTAARNEGETVTVNIASNTTLLGTFEVATKAKATIASLYVDEGAIVEINGAVTAGGAIRNSGTINFNGTVGTENSHNLTIYTTSTASSVVVESIKAGKITVDDRELYLKTVDNTAYDVTDAGAGWGAKVNTLTIANLKGVIVTETITTSTAKSGTYKGESMPFNNMFIAGDTSIANTSATLSEYTPSIGVTAGTVKVSGELNLYKAQINVASGATFSVSGEVTVDDDDITTGVQTKVFGAGKLSVSGTLYAIGKEVGIATANITAVMYETKVLGETVYVYTNLADAIASGEDDLTVYGTLNITKDTVIPDGVSISATSVSVGSSSKSDVTLTVEDGGYLSFTDVTVYGTFYIENTDTGISSGTITADTSVLTETTAKYTNVFTALSQAQAGETVKITKIGDGIVKLDKSVSIPEGVTLQVPAGKTLKVLEKTTLTINGNLELKGVLQGYYTKNSTDYIAPISYEVKALTGDDIDHSTAVVKVNGYIVSTESIAYNDDTTYNTDKKAIVGAYYEVNGRYVISTPANAAEDILLTPDYVVTLKGVQSVGTVAYIGTSEKSVTVNVNHDITAKLMTVDFGTINFTNGIIVNGTFGTNEGTVTFANIKVSVNAAVADVSAKVAGITGYAASLKGAFDNDSGTTINDAKAASITIEGDVVIQNAVTVDLGYAHNGGVSDTSATKAGSLVINGDLSLIGGDSSVINATVTVNGNLYMENGAALTADNTGGAGALNPVAFNVLGTVLVAEQTTTINAAGDLEVANLFIGGTIYSTYEVGAGAVFNGAVTYSEAVYVFPGATVLGGLAEDLAAEDTKYTNYYIDGALWISVYGTADISTLADGKTVYTFTPAREDAQFVAWQYNYGGELYNVTDAKAVGDYNDVYAKYNYNIFSVTIVTDAGIKSVEISCGNEHYILTNAESSNQFTVNSIPAGIYKVSYTLKSGYEGDAVLSTSTGTVLKDNSFTVTGDDLNFKFQLQGTEKEVTPEPSPVEQSEWTITTILLVILVILIAVMAVIVAIRLNRS